MKRLINNQWINLPQKSPKKEVKKQNQRNKSITISSVKVSKDIRYAEIFFTTFESDILKVEKRLNKSSSFIKSELSKRLYIKRLPNLKFTYDATADCSERIENIIKTLPKN